MKKFKPPFDIDKIDKKYFKADVALYKLFNNKENCKMINTLKGVTSINGKPICVMDDLREKHPEKFNESGSMDYKWFEEHIRPNFNIFLRHDVDSLSFNMLTKPASEGGDLNRCQLVDLIETALIMLRYLNKDYPCNENELTISNLEAALNYQELRTRDRLERGVEGKYEK